MRFFNGSFQLKSCGFESFPKYVMCFGLRLFKAICLRRHMGFLWLSGSYYRAWVTAHGWNQVEQSVKWYEEKTGWFPVSGAFTSCSFQTGVVTFQWTCGRHGKRQAFAFRIHRTQAALENNNNRNNSMIKQTDKTPLYSTPSYSRCHTAMTNISCLVQWVKNRTRCHRRQQCTVHTNIHKGLGCAVTPYAGRWVSRGMMAVVNQWDGVHGCNLYECCMSLHQRWGQTLVLHMRWQEGCKHWPSEDQQCSYSKHQCIFFNVGNFELTGCLPIGKMLL